MRVYTCTPVEFGGGSDFFARDSGLLCRGFQAIGIESKAVMPGATRLEDEADLVRVDYSCLESTEWWMSLDLDALVLYAWSHPKFRKVAASIRKAGIFLILNQDHGGLVSPRAGFRPWLVEQWFLSGQGRGIYSWTGFLSKTLKGLGPGLLISDPLRTEHLRSGHVISCVSPQSAAYFRTFCQRLGGEDLRRRVTVVPHPVESRFAFDNSIKEERIVCVGRWTDERQKRPSLMMSVITTLLLREGCVDVTIVGERTPNMDSWHQMLPPSSQQRVHLTGRLDRNSLALLYRESQIFYSSSAFESFCIAAGEALCSGCSVVASHSVSMTSFDWFVSEQSGTLAMDDRVDSHVDAIQSELRAWNSGERDATLISEAWSGRLHADKVAQDLLGLIEFRVSHQEDA